MSLEMSIVLYIASFFVIWFGAGLIIKSVERLARKLKISAFAISFFVLGLLTSIPEMALGINAVVDNKPEIFAGNLLGGVVVIFLFIIPLLAILGNGVKLNHNQDRNSLLGLLFVIAAPALMLVDHKVTDFEAMILLAGYLVIFFILQRKEGVLKHKNSEAMSSKIYSAKDLGKVGLGVVLVYVSSQFILNQTLVYADLLHVPAYYISLVVLSLGTNLPELSLAIRGIISGRKDIAFGDYLGSAAANTLLFSVFSLASDGETFKFDNFLLTFLLIAIGLGLFYVFSRSKKDISRKEGFVLFFVYVVFIVIEVLGSGVR